MSLNTEHARMVLSLVLWALLPLVMDESPPCPLNLPVVMGEVAVQVEVSHNSSFLDHLIYLSTYNAKAPGHSSNQLLMFP